MDLRRLAQDVIDGAEDVEIATLSVAILDAIGSDDNRAALAQALPAFTRSVIVSSRTASLSL